MLSARFPFPAEPVAVMATCHRAYDPWVRTEPIAGTSHYCRKLLTYLLVYVTFLLILACIVRYRTTLNPTHTPYMQPLLMSGAGEVGAKQGTCVRKGGRRAKRLRSCSWMYT